MQCPGQDTRFWQPGDIYEVKCPYCGYVMEYFKDDTRLTCKGCGKKVRNPKLDIGCAEHCPFAAECLGHLVVE
jgi:ribosomal protein S27E